MMQESTIAKGTGFRTWVSSTAASAPMPPEAAFESDSEAKAEVEVEARETDLAAATDSESGVLPTPDDHESIDSLCGIHIDNNNNDDSNTRYNIDLDDITALEAAKRSVFCFDLWLFCTQLLDVFRGARSSMCATQEGKSPYSVRHKREIPNVPYFTPLF